jgi:protein gp37
VSTEIQWTDRTWNPTTGCDRVSPGCDSCYALTLAKRLKGMGSAKYQTDGDPRTSGPGFGLAMHEDTLDAPLHWRKPAKVFVNSMSDLFHPRITDEFIGRVWDTMGATPQHTYQILTKRAPRMASLLTRWTDRTETFTRDDGVLDAYPPFPIDRRLGVWPLPNVHMGVSVEDQQRAEERIGRLRQTPAAVRFLSCEPLLGPLDDLDLTGIGWVIVGGESGRRARRMQLAWARSIVERCQSAGVAVFVKQLGEAWGPAHHGKDDAQLAAWPADLRVREYPAAVAGVAS